MKILLVEDSATLRHAMRSFIVDAGHTPIIARSGEEALQMLENQPVDMIIMDVEMPGLNGFETTRLIREWLAGHWIPIVFVTGCADDESYREGIEAGGDDYLIKPVSMMIIKAKIRAMERIAEMRDQLNRLNNELEALSQLDSLTQIYNRRSFNELAMQQWSQTKRQQQPISLLMIDVDHFKLYNDHYGHPAGDACLKKITQAIKSCLHRTTDILGRYGGEEFIVLLPDTDMQGAYCVAQAINGAICQLMIPHTTSLTSIHVTASVGGATCLRAAAHSMDELIKHADRALYKAKRSGRNRSLVEEMASHKTLLIADTNPKSIHHFSELLNQQFNILTCESTKECLDLSLELGPDLILISEEIMSSDNKMLCHELKRNPKTSGIPVCIFTDTPTPQHPALNSDLGIKAYYDKTQNAQTLLSNILKLIN
jgi:diguanylate cyclase (GGDEF)-like protein